MAQLHDLVDALADIGALTHTQINYVARRVREAGLIRTGGRGRGGATMTPSDAAALLLGLLMHATTPERIAALRALVTAPLVSVRPGAHSSIDAFSRSPSRPDSRTFVDDGKDLITALAHLLDRTGCDEAASREPDRTLVNRIPPATLLGLDVLDCPNGSGAAIAILDGNGRVSTLRYGARPHDPGGMMVITTMCGDVLAAISRRLTDH